MLGDIQDITRMNRELGTGESGITKNSPSRRDSRRAYISLPPRTILYSEQNKIDLHLRVSNLVISIRCKKSLRGNCYSYSVTSDILFPGATGFTLRVKDYDELVELSKTREDIAFLLEFVPQLNREMFDIARRNIQLTFPLSIDYAKLERAMMEAEGIDSPDYVFIRKVNNEMLRQVRRMSPERYEYLRDKKGYPKL